MNNNWEKTPVTLLHEVLMKKSLMPNYNLILNGVGTHNPVFKYRVSASGLSAVGTGKSKKEAKHESARLLLDMLSRENSIENDEISEVNINLPYADSLKDNAVGLLTDYCLQLSLKEPEYELIRDEGLPHAKLFSYKCTVSSFSTEGNGRTKKQAKHLAAQEMKLKLEECFQDLQKLPSFEKDETVNSNKAEAVMEKLIEVRKKQNINSCPEQLGIPIADYYKIFKSDSFPKSEALEGIKYNDEEYFQNLDVDSLCKTILEELDFSYKLAEISCVGSQKAVTLSVKGPVNWAFIGYGITPSEAVQNVFREALIFLKDMSE